MDGLNLVAANFKIQHFVGADLSLLYKGFACYYNKKFPLGVVSMLALGYAGFADIHAELSATSGFHKLCKATSGINIHL